MPISKDIKIKIIIVDDSRHDHFFVKESLSDFKNVTFISFYNGEDFLNYIKEKSEAKHAVSELPDIVILDVNMPKLTGFEVFEKIKECGIDEVVKFFILTTSLAPSDIEKCQQLKLECHKKPFSVKAFSVLLQSIIKSAGLG
jgi:CheY-like chemotaxis protein